jgi:hypothetical protein
MGMHWQTFNCICELCAAAEDAKGEVRCKGAAAMLARYWRDGMA